MLLSNKSSKVRYINLAINVSSMIMVCIGEPLNEVYVSKREFARGHFKYSSRELYFSFLCVPLRIGGRDSAINLTREKYFYLARNCSAVADGPSPPL